MTCRLLGRLNDQAFATLSAVRYGPVRRIGFLVMPPTSCVGGVCWRQFASRGAADRAQRVADLPGKIKVAGVATTQKQQSASGLPTPGNNRINASLKL
jgi:hypothetical protein